MINNSQTPIAGKGFVVICDRTGIIESVVQNEYEPALLISIGIPLASVFDEGSREKAQLFISEACAKRSAFDWELVIPLATGPATLHCAAAVMNDRVMVIGASSRNSANQVMDEMLRLHNEQGNQVRTLMKDLQISSRGVGRDNDIYNELAQLNNQLSNMQREQLKKNHELEQALARIKQLEGILPLYTNCKEVRSAKILIVDDDEMNRKMLQVMLSAHFDNVFLACNGQEGLDLLIANDDIDLILMDLEMPVMDGREMLAVVKNLPNLRSIVVIIAAGNREDAISALVTGADDFITKPYDRLELSTRVTHHLKRKFEASERQQTEQKLQAITDSAQDGILMIDPQGIITYANPAVLEVFGYHPRELLGENLHNLLVPERFLTAHKAAFHEFQHTGTGNAIGKTIELCAFRKDGQEISVELSLASILFSGGWHAIGTVRNITERKKIEAELVKRTNEAEEASRTKSTFLATMSHDIRTPISGVIGLSDLLLDTDLTKEQLEYTELISRSGENLLGLINDILDFSKIEAGKLELEMLNFDLHSTVKDIVALFAHRVDGSKLKIEYQLDPAIPARLRGDPRRISQIFNNLVGNALKFTHEGKITINAKLQGELDNFDTILFEVHDTGIGIPHDRLAAVFCPYTQAEGSTTRKYGGTGLGLAICKQLVEVMEGEIGVTSEVGKGSTFWFTGRFEKQISEEPLATGNQVENAHDTSDPAVSGAARSWRILLAEDNPINQKIAANTLNKLGYSVDVVANGREAVRALELTDYDLVFMDCLMPEMNGFEATVEIRDINSDVLNHSVPIIAMTANAMTGDREHCLEMGMDDYLAKPIRKTELAEMMDKWLKDTTLSFPTGSSAIMEANNH